MEGYEASTYGDRFAGVYDRWYGDITDTDAAVAQVAAVADGGAVLELAVGSGRLAVPLAERGIEVVGIDASLAMLDRLRARPGGEAVTAVLGDMADLDLTPAGVPDDATFALVLVAYNALFNLTTAEDQQRCLHQVWERVAPGGVLVVEAFVPGPDLDRAESVVAPRTIAANHVVLSVSRRDPTDQTLTGSFVDITEAGIKLRPWHPRSAPPAEVDAMAEAAGLGLVERHGGWEGEPFTAESPTHVSIYRPKT